VKNESESDAMAYVCVRTYVATLAIPSKNSRQASSMEEIKSTTVYVDSTLDLLASYVARVTQMLMTTLATGHF